MADMNEENTGRLPDTEADDVRDMAQGGPVESSGTQESGSAGGTGVPRRYSLYDKFADHVSLRTIDFVIVITAVLIIGLLVYGIISGNH